MDRVKVIDALNPLAAIADSYSPGADDETLVYVHLGRLRNAREILRALEDELSEVGH